MASWGPCSSSTSPSLRRALPSRSRSINTFAANAAVPEPGGVCSACGSAGSRRASGPPGSNLRVGRTPPSSDWPQLLGSKTVSCGVRNGTRTMVRSLLQPEAGRRGCKRSTRRSPSSSSCRVGQRLGCDAPPGDGVRARRRRSDAGRRGAMQRLAHQLRARGISTSVR